MKRRTCLQLAATSAAAAAVPPAFALGGPARATGPDRTWRLGYAGVDADFLSAPAALQGRIPPGLRGVLFRNGPAVHQVGETRYRHWFDGDGMVQAFRIGPRGVEQRCRVVATHKRTAELEAGTALYPAFDTPVHGAPVLGPDSINPANISVLYHHDRLMALWEAGSAYEIDPTTLETRGVVTWSDETAGMPFSAHPRVEPDGTLWNLGYLSAANKLGLWRITPKGRLADVSVVDLDHTPMVHDFVVTERHLVVLLCPWHYEHGHGETFLESHVWHPERPTRVLIIDKNDFGSRRWLEIETGWVFHFGNGFEEQGIVRMDAALSADP